MEEISSELLYGIKKKSLFLMFNSGIYPFTILCAFVTIKLCIDCRNISLSCTTGNLFAAIKSLRTFPGPTDGSWLQSPTIIKRQPSGNARKRASNITVSTIDSSSITKASQSKRFFSFFENTGISFSFHSTSSSRCIVFASCPVNSDMRFAALPVGAASNTFSPFNLRIFMIALSVVVFPVPGPPVRIKMPLDKACFIASFWPSAY